MILKYVLTRLLTLYRNVVDYWCKSLDNRY